MTPLIQRGGAPFVLLDDARATGAVAARLYTDPVEIVATRRIAEVDEALAALRTATRGGLHAAGYLSYEAGAALEPRLATDALATSPEPLLWFGLFRGFETIEPPDVAAWLPDPAGAWAGQPVPAIDRAAYEAALGAVQALILAGDVYQANLTLSAAVRTLGHPLALYAGLRDRARAGYGGIVHSGRDWFLSLSPELFFALHEGRVTTRPMKGTAAPDADPASLANDPKQRAENLMIVDLLRNDLSRVARPGSVEVPELFRVERYPSVLQMTSTVTATLAPGRDAIDVIRALFPCGSITGAPKIRAMQAIAAIERRSRGAYTGSIGRIDSGGMSGAFNVAIRTLHCKGDSAEIGLGSGVVADSVAGDEWAETRAKGGFVADPRSIDLIETMAFDPQTGLARLELHLERMKASAAVFGYPFNRHGARNELQAATFRLQEPGRIRLVLSRSGALAIEVRPMPARPEGPVAVIVRPLPVAASDFRLRHKTSDRRFYDAAREGAFEVIFTDHDGFLTEGSFTNIFVDLGGKLHTPPLALGLLGGVLRSELLAQGRATETKLRPVDLTEGFYIGNALRGLLPGRLAPL